MRRPILAILGPVVLLIAAWVFSRPVLSPTPTPPPRAACPTTNEERWLAADVVLTGSVFMVVPAIPPHVDAIVTPLTIYRGQLSFPTLSVKAYDQSVMPVGWSRPTVLNLASDQPPYLFYLQRLSDGRFTTSTCAGTRLLGDGLTTAEREFFLSAGP